MKENRSSRRAGSPTTADKRGKRPGWLLGVSTSELDEKLLDVFHGCFCFGGGEDDGCGISTRVLMDYDVAFFADVEFRPVAWADGVGCDHAFRIQLSVRGGKLFSYTISGENGAFARVLPQNSLTK